VVAAGEPDGHEVDEQKSGVKKLRRKKDTLITISNNVPTSGRKWNETHLISELGGDKTFRIAQLDGNKKKSAAHLGGDEGKNRATSRL